MRKSVAHLSKVSPLLSPKRPLTALSPCCWQTHLRDMLSCFGETLLAPRSRFTKLRYQQQRQYTYRSRFYSSASCAATSSSGNERPRKYQSRDSPDRLYGALAIFNWTDHIALSDLENALTKQQAEKSWQLFCTLTCNDTFIKTGEQDDTIMETDRNGDDIIDLMTVPYHHCAQLYALLLYAQDLSTHPNVIALRQEQLDQVANYVEDQLGQPRSVFLESITRRPVPTYKRLQQALRHNHRQSAWYHYTQLLKEDPVSTPGLISRSHYLKLLSLILDADTQYLDKRQQRRMIQTVIRTHQGIPCQHGRILTADEMKWIARIYSRYDTHQPKAARRLINRYLKDHRPTSDAIGELVWRVLPFDLETAHMVLTLMHKRGQPQNESTYCNLIKAYTSARRSGHALEVFEQMLTLGVTPTLPTFNAVIHLFADQGLTDRAEYMWDTLLALELVPDAATFSEMIRCFGHAGNLKSCLHYYHLMIQQQQRQQQQQQQKQQHDSATNSGMSVVAPNVYTYSTLIEAFGKQNDVRGVLKWFQILLRQGLAPNQVIISNVLKALGKHHRQPNMMEAVRRISNQCIMAGVKADTSLYTLLLTLQSAAATPPRTTTQPPANEPTNNNASNSSTSQTEDSTKLTFAFQTYREMLAKCVEPNVYTYTALIDLCGRHGYLETAQQLFDFMQRSDHHQPTTVTFCAMLEMWRLANQKDQVDHLLYEFLVQSKSNGRQGNRLSLDLNMKRQFRCYSGC